MDCIREDDVDECQLSEADEQLGEIQHGLVQSGAGEQRYPKVVSGFPALENRERGEVPTFHLGRGCWSFSLRGENSCIFPHDRASPVHGHPGHPNCEGTRAKETLFSRPPGSPEEIKAVNERDRIFPHDALIKTLDRKVAESLAGSDDHV